MLSVRACSGTNHHRAAHYPILRTTPTHRFTRFRENDYSPPRSSPGPVFRSVLLTVTIKDVARQANVSVATVSRALNGHENVAEAVRKRVLQVANELRYSPHHAARSLSSR